MLNLAELRKKFDAIHASISVEETRAWLKMAEERDLAEKLAAQSELKMWNRLVSGESVALKLNQYHIAPTNTTETNNIFEQSNDFSDLVTAA